MESTRPEQIALQLGVTSDQIRKELRQRFKFAQERKNPDLTKEQVQYLREHFKDGQRDPTVWSLEPGDTVLRKEVHATYKGSSQAGICTSTVTTDILVFTDPAKGQKYGYDQFEGLNSDGTYTYTGAGQKGDQVFKWGNRALYEAASKGNIIRLFVSKGVNVTYEGAFITGDPVFTYRQIPDTDGNMRQGIIFNFLPLGKCGNDLPTLNDGSNKNNGPIIEPWNPPNSSNITLTPSDDTISSDRVMSRVEHELQAAFGKWIREEGHIPKSLSLPVGSSAVKPDLYVPDLHWVVEAKKSVGRNYVRMAIGQVLDYAHLATNQGISAIPVILLPGEPSHDLQSLISKLGIILAVRERDSFRIISPKGKISFR